MVTPTIETERLVLKKMVTVLNIIKELIKI